MSSTYDFPSEREIQPTAPAQPAGEPGEEDVAIALFVARHHGLTNIMPWDDIDHDGRDYWRTIARNLMRTHRVVPVSHSSAGNADGAIEAMAKCDYWNGRKSLSETVALPTVSAMQTALRYMQLHGARLENDATKVSGAGEGAEIYRDAAKCIAFVMDALPQAVPVTGGDHNG